MHLNVAMDTGYTCTSIMPFMVKLERLMIAAFGMYVLGHGFGYISFLLHWFNANQDSQTPSGPWGWCSVQQQVAV